MAFYAEISGFVAVKKGLSISSDVVAEISKDSPFFKLSFSGPSTGKNCDYFSFACSQKIDHDEEVLWLKPFESVLKEIDFISATVFFVHEESEGIGMHSYIKQDKILKISSVLKENFVAQSIVN